MLSRLFRRQFIEGSLALHRAGELSFYGDLAGLNEADAFAAWLAPRSSAHIARTMPRLRREDAHHRDLPTRPETAIPRTTTKAGSLMRCTSLSHGYSLNSIAFRANTGTPQAEVITSSAQQLHRTDLANDVQIPRIGARTRKPSSPWINHRRVSSMLSP